MGIDMKQRGGLFEAHLDVMRALWAGEAVTETKYWNLKDATISPRPAEPVEVWIGGVGDIGSCVTVTADREAAAHAGIKVLHVAVVTLLIERV